MQVNQVLVYYNSIFIYFKWHLDNDFFFFFEKRSCKKIYTIFLSLLTRISRFIIYQRLQRINTLMRKCVVYIMFIS